MALCYPTAVGLNKSQKVTENVSNPGTTTTTGTSSSMPSSCATRSERCAALPSMSSTMELLKVSKDIGALKFIKKKVRTHIRAKRREKSGAMSLQP